MILLDSYGWIEYFAAGEFADKYAKYVEQANEEMSAADISLKFRLGMADAIVYATAKTERAKLVTSDVHFKGYFNHLIIT